MPRNAEGFDPSIPLPPELKIAHIRKAIDYIEKEISEFVDVYYEQANVFSGLIGIFGVRALSSISPYKKHKHPDVAQQRFPDLSLKGKLNPPPNRAVESKGSTRPKAWWVMPIVGIGFWVTTFELTTEQLCKHEIGKQAICSMYWMKPLDDYASSS